MKIGVPKEVFPGERRVALVPSLIPPLLKAGHEVRIEPGAGFEAGHHDREYQEKGATLAASRDELYSSSDIILQVRAAGAAGEAGAADLARLRAEQIVIAAVDPLGQAEGAKGYAEKRVTLFGMELVPRITRAQSMDILSSQAMVAG